MAFLLLLSTCHQTPTSAFYSRCALRFKTAESQISTQQTIMTKLKLLSITALCAALASSVHAQTTDGSMLYTPNVDLTTLSQNSFVGTVGGIFLTSYSYYPELNYLGYADPTGAPLVDSHVVTLWDNSTGNVIASATVAAGNAAPLIDGYRWVQLSSTVTLNYGSYYVIGAQTDGTDLWGDVIGNNSPDNGSNGQINWNSQYVQLGSGWEFTRPADTIRLRIIRVSRQIRRVCRIRFIRQRIWALILRCLCRSREL